MARKNDKGEGTPAIGHNSLSEQGKKFVERIENLSGPDALTAFARVIRSTNARLYPKPGGRS